MHRVLFAVLCARLRIIFFMIQFHTGHDNALFRLLLSFPHKAKTDLSYTNPRPRTAAQQGEIMSETIDVKKPGRLKCIAHRVIRRTIGERVCNQHFDGRITRGRLRETKDGKLLVSSHPFCWHPANPDGTTNCQYLRKWFRGGSRAPRLTPPAMKWFS